MKANMKTPSILLCLVLFLCTSLVYGHDACKLEREFLSIAVTAKACKDTCKNSTLGCIAWQLNEDNEKCSGWYINNEPDPDDYDYDYYNYYSYDDYDHCGIVATPNVTVPLNSNGKREGCEFELKDLGDVNSEQACVSVCQNLESNIYGGCIAWQWEEDDSCVGLLVASSFTYEHCGVP